MASSVVQVPLSRPIDEESELRLETGVNAMETGVLTRFRPFSVSLP
jgi:hypothetical protein